MTNYVEKLAELKKGFGAFGKATPEVIGAFGQIRANSCKEGGALSFKVKELLGVAVAVARKCEPCILSHIEVAVEQGVTREELVEALNLTVLLCGGPGYAYSAMALEAYDQFAAAKK